MTTPKPPDVPSSVDPKTADYLRHLSLWIQQELAKRPAKNEALDSLILMANDQKPVTAVWRIGVDHTGAFTKAQITLGLGKP